MIAAGSGRLAAQTKPCASVGAQAAGAPSAASHSPADAPRPGTSLLPPAGSGSGSIAPASSSSIRPASRAACAASGVAGITGSALSPAKPKAALASLRADRSGSLISGSWSARAASGSLARAAATSGVSSACEQAASRPGNRRQTAERILPPCPNLVKKSLFESASGPQERHRRRFPRGASPPRRRPFGGNGRKLWNRDTVHL